ncbi:MAG: hypothetical protein ACJ746_24680 [Bryobacteraceae bacterium]
MRSLRGSLIRLFALLCSATAVFAATSTSWETAGYADFAKGRFSGLSLSSDGTVQLGPPLRWRTNIGQPTLWGLALAPDGNLYAATGHSGRVFRIAPDGTSQPIWKAEQSEVFAIAIGPKGAIYAGSSPNGGLFRLEGGKAEELWHSPAKYIWSVQPAPDGSVFVGTGDGGRIYRVDSQGKAEVYYDTRQANVTALTVAPNGQLYAGTEPNGLVYHISGKEQGSILYDSSLPEIRAIVIHASGSLYVAAMGGAVSSRTNTPAPTGTTPTTTVTTATPTVITVTESAKGVDSANVSIPADTNKQATGTAGTASTTAPVTETAGVEKSAIYRIAPDRTVETIRTSKEDNVYDLLVDGESIIFSTDDRGRIYRWNAGKTTLLVEPGDGETTRLLHSSTGFYAGISNPARALSFGMGLASSGWYESQVHDSGSVARWGHLQWHEGGPALRFRTRTGNSARPDNTWSPWSEPISDPQHALITSPVGRFVQWRAEWQGAEPSAINSVSVPYLPQNTSPSIRSLSVTSIVGTNAAKSAASAPTTGSAYSVTVTDTGEPPAATSTSTSTQTVSRLQTTQTQISWQADDSDGDKLLYAVYFRPEDGKGWQLIRNRMFENTLLLDPDVLADGRYLFRVVASDAPGNPTEFAKQTELVSTPVLIDNTPPVVSVVSSRRDGGTAEIDWDVIDSTSPLRKCEYSLDTGVWQPVEATDGVTDSPREHYHERIDKLSPGEHMLVLRAYDAAGNAGLARVLIR